MGNPGAKSDAGPLNQSVGTAGGARTPDTATAAKGPAQPAASPNGAEAIPDSSDLLGIKAFVPVSLAVIRNTDMLPFHIHIRHQERGFVPFRFKGTPLTDRDRIQLQAQGIRQVYVDVRHHEKYCQCVEGQLDTILADASIDIAERARLLYQVADRLLEEMVGGLVPDHLRRARQLVRLLASHTLHTRTLPEAMEAVAAKEYHPAAHAVHVCSGVMRLGMAMKLPLNQLGELALGGLLHDVGVPAADYAAGRENDRPVRLDQQAYLAHPRVGADRVRGVCPNSPDLIAMVAQHHERPDGAGFPDRLAGEKIHLWARLCAVVETYDSLVFGSPGQQPVSPAEAVARMEAEVGQRFDPAVFAQFKRQAGSLTGPAADPRTDLDRELAAAGSKGPASRERRAHPRFPFHVPLVIYAESQGDSKPLAVEGLDISRSGIHFLSKQPLVVSENIAIDLPVNCANVQGPTRRVRARVVRCEPSPFRAGFDVGAKFLNT